MLFNTYGGRSQLFVDGETIYSCEGTTQGNPLAMVLYALATIPLGKYCKVEAMLGDVWFTDDATGGGPLLALRSWWENLNKVGPSYGYYPNGSKTWLIVKLEEYGNATNVFSGTNVQISIQGKRHLGAALGSRSCVDTFTYGCVSDWICELKELSQIAISHSQAAYSASMVYEGDGCF